LGSAGLARGYAADSILTAQRFVPDPFSLQAGARLYRSGDRVRQLPDGRIELGEIEAALLEHANMKSACVIAQDCGGEKRLLAYLVADPADPQDPKRV